MHMSKFIFFLHFAPALRPLVCISLLQRNVVIQLMQYIFLRSGFIQSNGRRREENGFFENFQFYEFWTRWTLQLWSFIFGPRWDGEKMRCITFGGCYGCRVWKRERFRKLKGKQERCTHVRQRDPRAKPRVRGAHCFANTIAANWVISKMYKHLHINSRRNIAMK